MELNLKRLVILNVCATFALFGFGFYYELNLPQQVLEAQAWLEELNTVNDSGQTALVWLTIPLFAGHFLSLFLLYRLSNLGRTLFLMTSVFGLGIMPFVGYTVSSPLYDIVEMFGILLEGALFYGIYFSEAKTLFEKSIPST